MQNIGKYKVLEKIGVGGFAVVYKGYDPFIKRPVAIKICLANDAETRKRFYREAEIAGRLAHRNITAVYDFGLEGQMPYLVEEYLPGEDLAQRIHRQEPAFLEEKLDILTQIVRGLAHAHSQGVIHRDIKPSNIRVLDSGLVKIMDFGTAKLSAVDSQLTQAGMTLGTVAYLPPERLLGEPGSPRSDIFSTGVLAYELIAFRRPFVGRNIPALIDALLETEPQRLTDCPEDLAKIVERCLRKDPQQRFSNSSELLASLEAFRTEHTAITRLPLVENEAASEQSVEVRGLLQRARQLLHEGKAKRAEVMLREVLEIEPGHLEAERLLESFWTGAASAPAASPVPTATSSTGSAATVALIEDRLAKGQLGRAAANMRLAASLDTDLDTAVGHLQGLTREALAQQLDTVREDGARQAVRLAGTLAHLRGSRRLPLVVAEDLAGWIEELDPRNTAGRQAIDELRNEALSQPDPGSNNRRRQSEAVASIERLLADGDPSTAAQALRFAVDLLGEFDAADQLRARIDQARVGSEP